MKRTSLDGEVLFLVVSGQGGCGEGWMKNFVECSAVPVSAVRIISEIS
jgi:hypothetical protein